MPRLRIEVVKAKGLSQKGDYFVVIKSKLQVVKTNGQGYIPGMATEWHENHTLVLKDLAPLKVELHRKGAMGSKALGTVELNVENLYQNVNVENTLTFEDGISLVLKLTALDFGYTDKPPESAAYSKPVSSQPTEEKKEEPEENGFPNHVQGLNASSFNSAPSPVVASNPRSTISVVETTPTSPTATSSHVASTTAQRNTITTAPTVIAGKGGQVKNSRQSKRLSVRPGVITKPKPKKRGFFAKLFKRGPSKKEKAAVTIQRWYINMRAAKHLLCIAELWREEVQARRIQRWWRRMMKVRQILPIAEWWRREVKAIKIQRWRRRMLKVRRLLQIANWWKKEVSAIKIQRFYRKISLARKIEAAARVMKEVRAAKRMQSRWRRKVICRAVFKIVDIMKHRNLIVREIVSTEESYVKGLKTLIDIFYQPLLQTAAKNAHGVDQKEINKMFSNVLELKGTNEIFLQDLKSRTEKWRALDCIGDLFLKWAPFFKAYPVYINQYDEANKLVEEKMKGEKKFKKFIESRKGDAPAEVGYSWFSSLLITPIQRIPRYELLLRDLLKFTEKLEHRDAPQVQAALSHIKEIASYINEKKRKDEENKKLYELMQISAMGTQLQMEQLEGSDHSWKVSLNNNLNNCMACGKPIHGLGKKLHWCKVCGFTCHKSCRNSAPKKCVVPKKGVRMNLLQTHQDRAIKRQGDCMHAPLKIRNVIASKNSTITASKLGQPRPAVLFLFTDALGVAYLTGDEKTPYKFVHMEEFISSDGMHTSRIQEGSLGIPNGHFGFHYITIQQNVHAFSFPTGQLSLEWREDIRKAMDDWIMASNKRRSSMYGHRSPLEGYPGFEAIRSGSNNSNTSEITRIGTAGSTISSDGSTGSTTTSTAFENNGSYVNPNYVAPMNNAARYSAYSPVPGTAHSYSPDSGATPLNYSAGPTPLNYSGGSAPLNYSAGSAPLNYSAGPTPLNYSAGSAPLNYSAGATPLNYSADSIRSPLTGSDYDSSTQSTPYHQENEFSSYRNSTSVAVENQQPFW